jgi:electron transfer flavoprotein beta subunit
LLDKIHLRRSIVDIVVLMKQVPDTEAAIKVNAAGTGIVEDDIKWVMNPYCEFAVEEGLRARERFGG